ncbi:MAG: hypothetical protein EOP04_16140 [Proteobacteria bacterium]|nr:MAG: hypothetical protein EOP04_16140 [Pseudomonadota bacterium]
MLPYRKECIPRLLELADSRDEEVSLIAFEALIRVDEYYTWAKGKLHQGFLNEIENHPNDRRILILHSLMGGFVYVAEKEGIEILHFFRELALKHKAATIVEWLNYRIPDSK